MTNRIETPDYKFPMSAFREAAKTARSWTELANLHCMSPRTAQYTCKIHGITPVFKTKSQTDKMR
jgi:hypothetical protein